VKSWRLRIIPVEIFPYPRKLAVLVPDRPLVHLFKPQVNLVDVMVMSLALLLLSFPVLANEVELQRIKTLHNRVSDFLASPQSCRSMREAASMVYSGGLQENCEKMPIITAVKEVQDKYIDYCFEIKSRFVNALKKSSHCRRGAELDEWRNFRQKWFKISYDLRQKVEILVGNENYGDKPDPCALWQGIAMQLSKRSQANLEQYTAAVESALHDTCDYPEATRQLLKDLDSD